MHIEYARNHVVTCRVGDLRAGSVEIRADRGKLPVGDTNIADERAGRRHHVTALHHSVEAHLS